MGGGKVESASTGLTSREVIGLVDAHAFYVSCHRLFTPSLQNRPVVVLSNNDSAVVARSEEAKALGIKMSQPAHELRHLQNQGLVMLSSNFPLYGDMHRRLMQAIGEMVAGLDVYSVDEAFFSATGMNVDLEDFGHRLRQQVLKKVGIPCGVGISRNRTTAKLANHASKKWKRQTNSVVALMEWERLRKLLAITEVSDIWGIGSRLTAHLQARGITNAQQLADCDIKLIRKLHGITVERTVRELRWELAIQSENLSEPKKSMSCTRTFPTPVSDYMTVAKAINTFAANLGQKLRRDKLLCAALQIFIQPARSCLMTPRGKSATIALPSPTSDTRELQQLAIAGLQDCWQNDGTWIRAGVIVVKAEQEEFFTPQLFAPAPSARSRQLMSVIDNINSLSGSGTIRFGGEHCHLADMVRRGYPTKRFTTSWSELPVAK